MLAVPVRAADGGKIACEITENGQPASGTIVVLDGARELARGSCSRPIAVPPGEHTAVLTLDGALDTPAQEKPGNVQPGGVTTVRADFVTGTLEVRFTNQGRDAAGSAVIRKDGRQIGTLGSGVSAHLSTGTYEVIARYRSLERRFDKVVIAPGQPVVLTAAFE